jgi:hypothetical protein
MNLAREKIRNGYRMNSYYYGRTDAFSTKIGLSSGAVTVCCSLCDELPDFGRSENDRQPLKNFWTLAEI